MIRKVARGLAAGAFVAGLGFAGGIASAFSLDQLSSSDASAGLKAALDQGVAGGGLQRSGQELHDLRIGVELGEGSAVLRAPAPEPQALGLELDVHAAARRTTHHATTSIRSHIHRLASGLAQHQI